MAEVFMAAKRKVELLPGSYTWLGAIHSANVAKKKIMPNSFFDEVFLGKNGQSLKPIPEGIMKAGSLFAGTFGLIGAPGKPLGKKLQTYCQVGDNMKNVVITLNDKVAHLVDTLVLCDHGFATYGTPLLTMYDDIKKPICTDDQMDETKTVLLRLNGNLRFIPIPHRSNAVFEKVRGETTLIDMPRSGATLGLLRRGSIDGSARERRNIHFFTSFDSLGVLVDAAPGAK